MMPPTANREPRTANCRFEQAVYGSFPFWDKGYALLAYSPGCRGEWLKQFQAACRTIGEPPRNVAGLAGTMFSRRIGDRGPWMIVGVSSPGADDRGRPDALAFHGIFVEEREFRRVDYDPFAFVEALRSDWSEATRTLSQVDVTIRRDLPEPSEQARHIAAILTRGKRVAIESASPICGLAREVWSAMPTRERRKRSVATWAFSGGTGLDLFAAPRLAGMELDASYVDPSPGLPLPRRAPRRRLRLWHIMVVTLFVALMAGVVRTILFAPVEIEIVEVWSGGSPAQASPPPHPDRSAYHADEVDPAERDAVHRGLTGLAARFGTKETPDPGPMMRELAGVRYGGPVLSESDLAAISGMSGSGRSRALAWDRMIRRFLPDRHLPADFSSGPLRWQIDTLAWAFGLEPDPKLTPSEAIEALAEALTLDEPIRPNPLESKYPALKGYASFLERLPVR